MSDSRHRDLGWGIFAASLLLFVVEATSSLLTVPLPKQGISVRIQRLLFDAGQYLFTGAVVGLLLGLSQRLADRR
ncbi:MAG TPA: hypothetical protein VGP93_12165, partial [Polyangiaceae bacterium]|nr:hypothetical protein [Polyangiaceae bacterium]